MTASKLAGVFMIALAALFSINRAQAHEGHQHSLLHGDHSIRNHGPGHPFSIFPYLCDTVSPSTESSRFVHEGPRIPLRVTATTQRSYCLANAGGIVDFPSNLVFNSASVLAKGDLDCAGRDYGPWLNVVFIDPVSHLQEITFADPCDGTIGPITASGYRLVSWTGPNQTGVPVGATILGIGFNNDATDGPGDMLLDRFTINGIVVAKDLHSATVLTCPFPDPDCEETPE